MVSPLPPFLFCPTLFLLFVIVVVVLIGESTLLSEGLFSSSSMFVFSLSAMFDDGVTSRTTLALFISSGSRIKNIRGTIKLCPGPFMCTFKSERREEYSKSILCKTVVFNKRFPPQSCYSGTVRSVRVISSINRMGAEAVFDENCRRFWPSLLCNSFERMKHASQCFELFQMSESEYWGAHGPVSSILQLKPTIKWFIPKFGFSI